MRTAQQIWAGPVVTIEGDLERMCSFLDLAVPQGGPRASGCSKIDQGYLNFVLVGLHEWVMEKGRGGGDYNWLAAVLLSAFAAAESGDEQTLNLRAFRGKFQLRHNWMSKAELCWRKELKSLCAQTISTPLGWQWRAQWPHGSSLCKRQILPGRSMGC